ncbi:aldehyde dehydrogenase (NADP(+)) [Streptomyces sp. KR80]|uniref:aldehyde dehydrogenase (NADP(+)) n=1 Tax=Streptomyces sp. KR80 TaxID=3457426 RepID=UPI003FD69A6F
MSDVYSVDPRTGMTVELVGKESDDQDVSRVCQAAADAAEPLAAMDREHRRELLRLIASELEADGVGIVLTAERETALGTERLRRELARTCDQLRFFGEVLRDGSYVDAVIDHGAGTADSPGPDLRRMLVPFGPVAVFGSSNFPLAFGVAGGDTAAALAAGCPVVIKAHPSHPATCLAVFTAVTRAVARAGAPAGSVGLVWGFDAGALLVSDPRIKAVAFTGSLTGGRHLHDLAASRAEPIPFYGELSSTNPVFVTPGAARDQHQHIAQGFLQSFSFGHGQVCTKPGLLLIPAGSDGAPLRDALAEGVGAMTPGWLLNDGIRRMFLEESDRLSALAQVSKLAEGPDATDELAVRPVLLTVAAKELLTTASELLDECFGPLAVVAEYENTSELFDIAGSLTGQLSAAVHAADDETDLARRLLMQLSRSCGRIVWNGFTTGVTVGWATHHGGPYPATTAPGHTSVGARAIARFLRPVCYQSVPDVLLPQALQDSNPLGLPRQEDGRLNS